ncbi:MAG: galactose mutarotase [Verrucomicrobia bacterium]|nr:galactose mutarotase [Verrucomicrobiota bacterium]
MSAHPSITRSPFGRLPDGRSVERFTLANGKGLECDIITYGGIVTALRVPFREGKTIDVVLGFDHLEDYLDPHPCFGTLVGRVAGRISGGRFTLDGKEYPLTLNDAPNHLHGGPEGFDKRLWNAEQLVPSADEAALRLTYLSPDGEEGYPGNLRVEVTYAVTVRNELVIRYSAETDHATPLSLTNHSYFNLTGEGSGDMLSQTLQVFSDEIAATDDTMTLLGTKSAVASQGNDLNTPRLLGEAIPRLLNQHGDNHFIRRSSPGELVPAAILADPASGLTMTALTTQDCVQVFSATILDGSLTGKSGRPYEKHAGLCLECQGCPGAVHTPLLGDIILRPGNRYDQTTIYRFAVMA